MRYEAIVSAIFIDRPNRFIANVLVDGKTEMAHVKNTGRCKELLIKGTQVFLCKEGNPARKTKYSLISVYKNKMLINIDSQAPNRVVYEALICNFIKDISPSQVEREQKYEDSRFDIKFSNGKREAFMEIKGVTLEVSGMAKFPDAPTQRGTKHINHLISAVKEGYEGYIFFLIQMAGINRFMPNKDTDPIFANTLKEASENGVKLLCYNSIVNEDSISIGTQAEIIL